MKIKLPEHIDFYFDGGCDTFSSSDFEEQNGRYVLKNSFESVAFSIKNGELTVFLRSGERKRKSPRGCVGKSLRRS